jgi:hypothetical protein
MRQRHTRRKDCRCRPAKWGKQAITAESLTSPRQPSPFSALSRIDASAVIQSTVSFSGKCNLETKLAPLSSPEQAGPLSRSLDGTIQGRRGVRQIRAAHGCIHFHLPDGWRKRPPN